MLQVAISIACQIRRQRNRRELWGMSTRRDIAKSKLGKDKERTCAFFVIVPAAFAVLRACESLDLKARVL